MAASEIQHIRAVLSEEQLGILRQLKGRYLQEIRIDELVIGATMAEFVTDSGCVRVKNMQYEAPLKEDGRDYPALSVEETDHPMEGTKPFAFGEKVLSVSVFRVCLQWHYGEADWDIQCDTSLCIVTETRRIEVTALDSEEGALSLQVEKKTAPPSVEPYSWADKCEVPDFQEIQEIML